jgi:6-phosphogluconolactonase (cycloisomerase 2 family)
MRGLSSWVAACVAPLLVGVYVAAQQPEKKGEGRLELVESVAHDELEGVVTAAVSPDGKWVYGASWKAGSATVSARDEKTGRLQLKQTVHDADHLPGTTALTLSPNGHMAIATAFQSKTAVLYLRDAATGELTQSDVARHGEKQVQMQFPIDAAFSLDSKFVYVLDDNGPPENGQGSIVTFRVNDGKLELVGVDEGKDGCYFGARGLAFHPDGKTIFVACYRAGTLVVVDRDPATGKTKVRQVIKDEKGDVHGLAGAMGVVTSKEGRFVYVSAGRFEGDDAISAFQLLPDGRLAFLQEFIDGEKELHDFTGGNHLALSPDGLSLYAAATRSGTVACFRRDPVTGSLTYLETIPDGATGGEFRAAGVGVSPDGQHVYVATEDGKSISVFQRNLGRGR